MATSPEKSNQQRHPHADALWAYADGELPDIFVAELVEHLESCADCRELVAEYREFPALKAGAALPSAAERQADWQAVLTRLRSQPAPQPMAEDVAPAPVEPAIFPIPVPVAANDLAKASPASATVDRHWRRGPVLAAAAVAALVVSLGVAGQQSKIRQLEEARNAIATDRPWYQQPLEPLRGAADEVDLGKDGADVRIPLAAGLKGPFAGELVGPSRRWNLPNWTPRDGYLQLGLPAGTEPGTYQLRVADRDGREVLTLDLKLVAKTR